uniref:CC2D2AN-C2 domain-containing protein n=1 Tax=Globodera pallida TaxID=36090 RepID=A0A183BYG6_GLOPA
MEKPFEESNRPKGWTADLSPPAENASKVLAEAVLSPNNADGVSSPVEELFARVRATKSVDELSQSSSSSTSASRRHLPAGNGIPHARQRIREQARSMLERRKLAKRSAMVGKVGGERIEMENEAEIERGDAEIEQSIKLGAKYVGQDQLFWEEQIEADKCAGGDIEKGEVGKKAPLVTLARPLQHSAEKQAKFIAMLKWEPRIESEIGRSWGQIGQQKGMDKPQILLDAPQRAWPPEYEFARFADQPLFIWSTALSWAQWVRRSGNRQWARRAGTGLWLDMHRLEFDHHWLFTAAELHERALLRAFESFVGTHERALKAAKEWLTAKQAEEEERQGEGEMPRGGEHELKSLSGIAWPTVQLDVLLGNVLRVQKELNLTVKALERAWDGADQTHGRFVLRRLEGHAEIFEEECEGGVPLELRDFFRSPMFVLSDRVPPEAITKHDAQRVPAVTACNYQIQIFFNDLIVCVSDPLPLHWPSFCVPIGRIFALRVFERPEKIRVRLLERLSRMAKWQEIADIFVPLPTEEEIRTGEIRTNEWPLIGLQFASTGSLGCGGQGGAVPFMQGRLFCALKSAADGMGEHFGKRREGKYELSRPKIKASEVPRPPSLFPTGAVLCSAQTLFSNLRLKELEKRWLDRNSRRPQQRVGLGEGMAIGVRAEMAEEDARTRGDPLDYPKRGGTDAGRLEARQRAGREMALALRRHLRESDEQRRRSRDPMELVREEPLPTLLLLPQLLISRRPFDISRRLKPMRRHPLLSLRRPINSEQLNKRRLILNVQFASFIPKRTGNAGFVQIFLRFSSKATSVSTTIVDGRHANWQETLVMEVGDQQGHSGGEDNDCLELDLFDVEVRPMEHDDRERDTRHEREVRRWLGSAQVPLRVLIALGKADGHLTLQGPVFHTGYRSHATDHPITVRLLITIDPPPFISLTPPIVGQFGDADELLTKCTKFEDRLRQRFPNRRVFAQVSATDGKRYIASRFLRPIAPPARIASIFSTNPKQAVSMAAQIAASIPILVDPDGLAFARTPIWSTIDEIFRFGTASADELGVLLCCWLLGLQLSAVLLLGPSLLGGPNSAAVLVNFSDGDQWLIIPTNGHHFDPSDATCPLLSVSTVLSSDNVFASLQEALHPSQLDFDLAKRAHWEPLLSPSGLRSGLSPSIQPAVVRYVEADEDHLLELRAGLERDIRLHFDQARPFAIPQWNLLASRSLREMLADSWEQCPDHFGSMSRLLDIDARLDHLQPAFRASAVAFRLPFVSRAQIVHDVIRTEVHLNSEPQAQFALAVCLQPMVGDVILGCAVAICTLLPNTSIVNTH